ncbi:MAG: OmpA family protein [Rhodobacteraceae bacterium]|nr:OmpA family protein [Paracoccaceae bacterium]
MSTDSLAPVIIKKKRAAAADGHHGGAWKVAYADFVTAMMAFFLLMWLLNSTTESQRNGLADYFSPTIPMNEISGGGDGAFWGDDVFAEQELAQSGTGASNQHPTEHHQASGMTGIDLINELRDNTGTAAGNGSEELLEELELRGGESMAALSELRHVVTRLSDQGLVIEIFDLPDSPLFAPETDTPEPVLAATLAVVSDVLRLVTNDVAVNGHLAARPVVQALNPKWDLSSARADTVRQALETSGLSARRVARLTGFADRERADPNPMAVRNNRIEVIILRDDI